MLGPRPQLCFVLVALTLSVGAWGCTQDSIAVGPLSATAPTTEDAGGSGAADTAQVPSSGWTVDVQTPPADGSPRLYLWHALDGQDLLVQVVIDGVDDLVGIAAHLRYDHNALELVESDGDASFLDSLTYRSKLLLHSAPDGRVLLGAARLLPEPPLGGPVAGAKAIEDATWATLRFRARAQPDASTGDAVEIGFDPEHLLARVSTYDRVQLAVGRLLVTPPAPGAPAAAEAP